MTSTWIGDRAMPRQGPRGDVLCEPVRASVSMDVREGLPAVNALIIRLVRSDVVLARGMRIGLGQVEFRNGGAEAMLRTRMGSSCLGGGCAVHSAQSSVRTGLRNEPPPTSNSQVIGVGVSR